MTPTSAPATCFEVDEGLSPDVPSGSSARMPQNGDFLCRPDAASSTPPAQRSSILDFLRCLCVVFVVYHHTSIRLNPWQDDGTPKGGYALSGNLWVLWYLTATSSMLFALSSRSIMLYIRRLGALFVIGCLFNIFGLLISRTHNRLPDGKPRFEFNFGWIMYQMYYVVIIAGLSLLFAPLRLHLDLDKRPYPPSIMAWRIISIAIALPLLAMVLLADGFSGWDDVSCKAQLFLACVVGLGFSAVGTLYIGTRPRAVAGAGIIAAIFYLLFMSLSNCRDSDVPGRVFRFIMWYGAGFVWGAALRKRKRYPLLASGVRAFSNCFQGYFLLAIPLMEGATPELMRFRDIDLRDTHSAYLNTMVGIKDIVLLLLFMGMSVQVGMGRGLAWSGLSAALTPVLARLGFT